MKYFAYALKSKKDGRLYTGSTNDLERRLQAHNSGKVKSTARRRPFELVYSETCASRSQARWREHFLKSSWGKKQLKRAIQEPKAD